MSAVLKKMAVSLLTDKKVLKTIGGIILGLLVIIAMPVAAVMALVSSDITIDWEELKQQVEAEISDEDMAGARALQDRFNEIGTAMEAAVFGEYAASAQNLAVVFVSDQMTADGFAEQLAGCYRKGQTNESFLSVFNGAFGTAVSPEELMTVAGDLSIEVEPETMEEAEGSMEETGGETREEAGDGVEESAGGTGNPEEENGKKDDAGDRTEDDPFSNQQVQY